MDLLGVTFTQGSIIKLQYVGNHGYIGKYSTSEGCFTYEMILQLGTCTTHMLFLHLKCELPSEGF